MDENLIKVRHARSQKDFPNIKIEEDEYVEFAFKRATICLLLILFGTGIGLILVLLAFLLVLMNQSLLDGMGVNFLYIILTALLAAAVIIGLVAYTIYRGNRLIITNKRAIQTIMISPVVNSINIIDLSSIEDVSFKQENILQKLFKYGTLRLATVGDETTYRFPFSDISPDDLKAVTDLVSNAKKKSKSCAEK